MPNTHKDAAVFYGGADIIFLMLTLVVCVWVVEWQRWLLFDLCGIISLLHCTEFLQKGLGTFYFCDLFEWQKNKDACLTF